MRFKMLKCFFSTSFRLQKISKMVHIVYLLLYGNVLANPTNRPINLKIRPPPSHNLPNFKIIKHIPRIKNLPRIRVVCPFSSLSSIVFFLPFFLSNSIISFKTAAFPALFYKKSMIHTLISLQIRMTRFFLQRLVKNKYQI